LSAIKEINEMAFLMQKIQEKEFFKFVTYLIEKKGEERKLSIVRRKFSEFLKDMDELAFLVEHEMLWIEMDGKLHPGRLLQSLYLVVSKMSKLTEQE
jgi:hypothetical protein